MEEGERAFIYNFGQDKCPKAVYVTFISLVANILDNSWAQSYIRTDWLGQ